MTIGQPQNKTISNTLFKEGIINYWLYYLVGYIMTLPKLITWTERVKNSYWQEAEQLALRRSATEELGGTNHDWNRFSDNFVSRVFHLPTSKGARYEKVKDPGNEVDSARGQRWTWTPDDQISCPALPTKALYKIRAVLYFLWASVLTPVVLWVDVTIQWMILWVWEIDGGLSETWHYLAFYTNEAFAIADEAQ